MQRGQKSEHRRAPSRSEGQHTEPRRRTALGPAPKQQKRTVANSRIGPVANTSTGPGFMRRGARGTRRSH